MSMMPRRGKCLHCGYDWDKARAGYSQSRVDAVTTACTQALLASNPVKEPIGDDRGVLHDWNEGTEVRYLEDLAEKKYLAGDNDSHAILVLAAHSIRKHDKIKLLQSQLSAALRLLAEWCLDFENDHHGWDGHDRDEHYHTVLSGPGPLRVLLDKEMAEIRAEREESQEDGDWKSRPDGGPK